MQVRILDAQHNAVTWELRSPLLKVELGILGGMALLVVVLLFNHSLLRWPFIAGIVVIAVGVALFIALTTPLWERGMMERTPEGGAVQWEQRGVLRRQPVTWESPLEALAGLWVAYRTVEETEGQTISAARLYARLAEGGASIPLTGWAGVTSVEQLAQAFAKAARLPLETS